MNDPTDKPTEGTTPSTEPLPSRDSAAAGLGGDTPHAGEPPREGETPSTPPQRVRRIVRSASTRIAEAAAAQAAADAAAAAAQSGAAPSPGLGGDSSATGAREVAPASGRDATPASVGTPAGPTSGAPVPPTPGGEPSSGPRPQQAARPTRDYRAPRPERPAGGGRSGPPPWAQRRDRRPNDEPQVRKPGTPPSSWMAASGMARPDHRPERPRRDPAEPGRDDRPRDRDLGPRSDRNGQARADRGDRPRGDRPSQGDRAQGDRPRGDRPRDDRPRGEAMSARPAQAVPPPPPSKPAAPPKPVHLYIPPPKEVSRASKPALTAKEALSAKAKAAAVAPPKKVEGRSEAATASAEFDAAQLAAGWDDARDAARRAGDAAPALVDAWMAAGNATAIAALADADDASGAARKAARRALNVLKARGSAMPERPRVARLAEEAPATLEATLIPPDASGTECISITSRDASGRYHIAEIIFREPVGVLHAGSAWLSGSQIKEGKNRAIESLGVAPVAVPLEWARHRVAAARSLNASSKQIVPLGFDGCRELLEPTPEQPPPHPMAELEKASADLDEAAGSQALHEEPEFRSWLPDRRAIEEMLQKLGENLGAEGLKDPEKVNKALGEEISAATDRFFSPEVRNVIADRMRDSAISVRARKGDDRAKVVLAVARAVREAGLITSPPRDVAFLTAFFQKAIGILAQQGGGSLRIPVPMGGGTPAATEDESEPQAEAEAKTE